jgi:HEAT repeat protein
MPLVRKPTAEISTPAPDRAEILRLLASGSSEERWAGAREAAALADGVSLLAEALPAETDARVREAMFTALARHGTDQGAAAVVGLLRSDSAHLRTAALDALRIMAGAAPQLLPALLGDKDADVRILSCELARSLPSPEATRLLCGLLADEQEINVCGAAVEVLAEVGNADALAALGRCADRFRDSPFVIFAIKTVVDRIHAQSAPPCG